VSQATIHAGRHRTDARRPVDWAGAAYALFDAASLGTLVCLLALGLAALLPFAFGLQSAVVVSASMVPAMRPGDLVFYQYQDPATLRPGRIVLADRPGRPGELLSHRLVRRRTDGLFVTKGDANRVADSEPVSPEAIHGAARLVVPYVGLLTLLDNPMQRDRAAGFAALVLFGCWGAIPKRNRRATGCNPGLGRVFSRRSG
jgi:signal peptidase I